MGMFVGRIVMWCIMPFVAEMEASMGLRLLFPLMSL